MRYIHKSPLRAGLSDDLNNYEWSSHHGYQSDAKRWEWPYKEFPLSMFAKDRNESRKAYIKHMGEDEEEEIDRIFQNKNPLLFLEKKILYAR
jgi:putative transposase